MSDLSKPFTEGAPFPPMPKGHSATFEVPVGESAPVLVEMQKATGRTGPKILSIRKIPGTTIIIPWPPRAS